MRKTLLGLATATGLLALGGTGASAAPLAPAVHLSHPAIQLADWYCGPRCQYWRHRHWVEEHRWRWHHPYYGYNGYYRDYR